MRGVYLSSAAQLGPAKIALALLGRGIFFKNHSRRVYQPDLHVLATGDLCRASLRLSAVAPVVLVSGMLLVGTRKALCESLWSVESVVVSERLSHVAGSSSHQMHQSASVWHELIGALPWALPVSVTLIILVGHLFARSLRSQWRFRDILDSMNEGVLVTDMVGCLTYANTRARELLGAQNGEIIGEHIATVVTGRWDIDASKGRMRQETRLQRSVGDYREVVIERSNLTDRAGALRGMLFVIEDVTEKSQLARDLANHRDMLARSERLSALGTLGAIVAHKLRQPITSVRLFLQQVKREVETLPVSQVVRDNLTDSLAELERITALTKQMLRAGHGAISEASERPCSASVLDAVTKIEESLSDTALRRGVSLSICASARDLKVECSVVELEEMLYCLVINSVQAAAEGSKARVDGDFERAGDMAVITVTDTCEGIPPDHLDKIFDCFFTTKPEGQGTGLGLAIVRHIAERHRGKVEVSSEEGFGSCFMISLPLSKEVRDDRESEGFRC